MEATKLYITQIFERFLKREHFFLEDIPTVISYENIFFFTPFPSSWKNLTDIGKDLSSRLWSFPPTAPLPSPRCVFLPDAWHGVEKDKKKTYRFLYLKS